MIAIKRTDEGVSIDIQFIQRRLQLVKINFCMGNTQFGEEIGEKKNSQGKRVSGKNSR